MRKFLIIILFSVSLLGNSIEIAKQLFDEKKDYKKALEIFNKLEENSEAQYYIGKAYLWGLGVEKDPKKAFEYAKKSAESTNPAGINLLGVIYDYGYEVVTVDKELALLKYKQAAELGNNKAMSNLTNYYIYTERNYNKACKYAKMAADLNDPEGLIKLGSCYQFGFGGYAKDSLEALINFKLAVKLGATRAAKIIGDLYLEEDELLKKDEKKALEWYKIGLDLGDTTTYKNLGKLFFKNNNYEKALDNYLNYEKSGFSEGNVFEEIALIYKIDRKENEFKKYLIKAYNTYLKDADNGDIYSMVSLSNLENKYNNLFKSTKGLDFLKDASFKTKNKEAMKQLYFQISSNLYDEKIDNTSTVNLLEKLYSIGSIRSGCSLSSYYGNNYDGKIDSEKSYLLAIEIIKNNIAHEKITQCYSALSYLYSKGDYLAQNFNKSISLNETAFDILDKKNYLYSEQIADIYLERLDDYNNARKWYKITYELTKDERYLNKVEKYRKNIPVYKIDKYSEQQIFPILDNFTKKEQVFIPPLETEKYFFLSTDDKSIKMYDKKSLELLKELRAFNGNGILGAFISMEYDEKNKLLYASTLNSDKDFSKNDIILVFDINTGKVTKTIKNNKAIKNTLLTLSDDGEYLVSINNENLINIININTNTIQHYNLREFGKFSKAKISIINDDYIIYLLSNDNQLFTFSLNKQRRISKDFFNNQITFKKQFKNRVNHSNSEMQRVFKFKSFDLQKAYLDDKLLKIQANTFDMFNFNFQNLNLQENSSFKDFKSKKSFIKVLSRYDGRILEVYDKNNQFLSEISLIGVNALKYKILDNKYILVVTSDLTNMLIFNLDGKAIVNLQGINSIQTNLSYKDGVLISFGADNIINIFNLKNLEHYQKIKQTYNEETLNSIKYFFGGIPLDIFKASDDDLVKAFTSGSNNFGFIPTANQIRSFLHLWLLNKTELKPISSLFFENKKDWIIYTPEGLFTYEGNGKDLLKYHQNQGLYKEANIIENDQLFDKFYRPDLIKKILAGEKVVIPLDVKAVIENIKPPELKILSNKLLENKKDIDLTYQICDAGNGIADPKLIINGQAINPPNSRGFIIKRDDKKENCNIYQSIHTLNPGINKISVKAHDKDRNIANESEILEVNADYKINDKSNLYFLSIAVSNYKEDNYDLKYPVNDANKVKEEILHKSKNIYERIYTYNLNDKDVTSKNIDELFSKISKKIKINDVFILYIAGHGKSENGLYQFLPYDPSNKISINDLKENLSKINTKKSLVLLDTCESGAALDNEIDETSTVNRLSQDDNRNYIVASSKNQVALEGYKEHGVFTYSVLDAFLKNDKLKVLGLADHVSEIVPKITKEKFHFEQTPQFKLNENFFIIGDIN